MEKNNMEENETIKPVMAEVKTLTIVGPVRNGKPLTAEVKALMIGGEWVTLRGFQQLQKEDLIDLETGLLTGEPWGRVNFDPGDCTTEDEHLHVVWQKGVELRRACVMGRGFSPFEYSSDYIELNPEARAELERAKLPLSEFKHNWKQSYTAIKETEQLFISV
jgi:hypothetical protein